MQFKNYNIEMVSSLPFYSIPKILIHNDFFKNLSSDAKILYTIMQNRVTLSQENNWTDENGDIYIYMTLEEATQTVNCSINTVRKSMKQLQDIGLIESIRQGFNKPNKIYVKAILDYQNLINQTIKNCNSGVSKNDNQDYQNLTPRKTEYSNTEYRKTDSSSSIDHHQLEEKEYVKKYVSVFPTCCSVDLEILSSYEEQGMEDAVICMAIEEAVRNNVRRLRYIETILQNWLNNNIKTVIQLEAYKNQRKEKGGVNNGPNSKNNGTTEATEDFFNGKLKEF